MSGEWLDEMPLESDDLEDEIAPEDDFDIRDFELAVREGRGDTVLDLGPPIDLDQQGYALALAQERRGTKPPGLTVATNDGESCESCAHYDPTVSTGEQDQDHGTCGLYTYPVAANDVCTEWESAD